MHDSFRGFAALTRQLTTQSHRHDPPMQAKRLRIGTACTRARRELGRGPDDAGVIHGLRVGPGDGLERHNDQVPTEQTTRRYAASHQSVLELQIGVVDHETPLPWAFSSVFDHSRSRRIGVA